MSISKYKDNAESFIKIFTITVGFLYVLGIMIQSIHDDSLGVSVSSFIQVRSILVGFSFLLYLVLFALPFIAFFIALFIIVSGMQRKGCTYTIMLLQLPILIFFFVYMEGIFLGYMTPWGRAWQDGYLFSGKAWSWSFAKKDIAEGVGNFAFAFNHLKVIIAAFFIFLYYLFLFAVTPKQGIQGVSAFTATFFIPSSPLLRSISIGIMTPFFILLLFAYAEEIFPNIKTNLGGGQPVIAALQLQNTKQARQPVADTTNNTIVQLPPCVLWKQDENFTFLTYLDSMAIKKTSIIAIKTSAIEEMKYFDGYVKINAGNQIVSYFINK